MSSEPESAADGEREMQDGGDTSIGKYPNEAGVLLASKDGSERFHFRTPKGTIASVPAMNADQARVILADQYFGFAPEDFEQVDGFDAEPVEYPDPVDSDREVNANDIWMLRLAMMGMHKYSPRSNPTERTVRLLLEEWDDPSEIQLHDRDALQQADGIGPHRAGQVVGAAVADRLIERPVRSESDV